MCSTVPSEVSKDRERERESAPLSIETVYWLCVCVLGGGLDSNFNGCAYVFACVRACARVCVCYESNFIGCGCARMCVGVYIHVGHRSQTDKVGKTSV